MAKVYVKITTYGAPGKGVVGPLNGTDVNWETWSAGGTWAGYIDEISSNSYWAQAYSKDGYNPNTTSWVKLSQSGSAWVTSFTYSKPVTYYDYYLRFNANGGSGAPWTLDDEYTTRTSSTFTIPSTRPTWTGRSFQGWSFNSSASSPSYYPEGSVTLYSSNPDRTLYAVWEIIDYSISYDLDGGSLPPGSSNRTSYNIETDSFLLIEPYRTNYTFLGWTGSNGTTPQKSVTISKGSTGNKSYKANWQLDTVSIILNAKTARDGEPDNLNGGGTVSYTVYGSSYKPLVGDTISVKAESLSGYSFSHWSDGGDQTHDIKLTTTSLTRTAYFNRNKYDRNYYHDETSESPWKKEYKWYDIDYYVSSNTPTKLGYSFTGWKDSRGNRYSSGDSLDTLSSINLFAQWSLNTYALNIKLNANINAIYVQPEGQSAQKYTSDTTLDMHYGEAYYLWAETHRPYASPQWSGRDVSASNKYHLQVITSDLTFDPTTYRQYSLRLETSTDYDGPGGYTNPDVGLVAYYDQGTSVSITATPYDTHAFVGWYQSGVLKNTNRNISISIDSDTVYSAHFKKYFSFSARSNNADWGSVEYTGNRFYEGQTIVVDAKPAAHYHVVNWDANGTKIPGSDGVASLRYPMLANAASLVCYFAIDTFKLTTEVRPQDAGSISVSPLLDEYPYDLEVTLTANSASERFDFFQWWGIPESGEVSVYSNPVKFRISSDTHATANFKRLYKLTTGVQQGLGTVSPYYPNGQLIFEGDTVSVSAHPDAENEYEFWHWNDGTTANPKPVTLYKDEVVLASFRKKHTYTVDVKDFGDVFNRTDWTTGNICNIKAVYDGKTYFGDNNSVFEIKGYSFDELTLECTVKPGYSFIGWNGSAETTNPITIILPDRDTKYSAHVEPLKYKASLSLVPADALMRPYNAWVAFKEGEDWKPSTKVLYLDNAWYNHEVKIEVDTSANIDYEFNGIYERGFESRLDIDGVYTYVATSDRTFEARFTRKEFTVRAAAYPAGGLVDGVQSKTVKVLSGEYLTLTAQRNIHYQFVKWEAENEDHTWWDIGTNLALRLLVQAPYTLRAVFEPLPFVQIYNTDGMLNISSGRYYKDDFYNDDMSHTEPIQLVAKPPKHYKVDGIRISRSNQIGQYNWQTLTDIGTYRLQWADVEGYSYVYLEVLISPVTYTYEVREIPASERLVLPVPGIYQVVYSDTAIQFQARDERDIKFLKWELYDRINRTTEIITSKSFSRVIDSNYTITAKFGSGEKININAIVAGYGGTGNYPAPPEEGGISYENWMSREGNEGWYETSDPTLWGQCTWYAHCRSAQMRGVTGVGAPHGPTDQSFPNASEWTPDGNWSWASGPNDVWVGDVAIWPSGYNHVGVVESIEDSENGVYTVSNWNDYQRDENGNIIYDAEGKPKYTLESMSKATASWSRGYHFLINHVDVVGGGSGSTSGFGGEVTGGGDVMEGDTVTLIATAHDRYKFLYWTAPDGTQYDTETITFTADINSAGDWTAYFQYLGGGGGGGGEGPSPLPVPGETNFYAESYYFKYTEELGIQKWNYLKNDWDSSDIDSYYRLDYIESDGNQYIDTNWYGNRYTVLEFEGNFTKLDGIQDMGSSTNSETFWCGTIENKFTGALLDKSASVTIDTNIHKFILNGDGSVSVDTTSLDLPTPKITQARALYLFSMSGNQLSANPSSFKMKSCKIYDLGELVRDFVPVQRKRDGINGLWDKVYKRFYPSSSGKNFIAGNIIEDLDR